MTVATFRRMALALPGVVESQHQGHADFRANGKVFATLGYPDEAWGMIKLALPEQARLIKAQPHAFKPAAGAWGARGSTLVHLAHATEAMLRPAMKLAWHGSGAASR